MHLKFRELPLIDCLRTAAMPGIFAIALLTSSGSAHANSIIVNGSFEQTTAGLGQFDYQTTLVGWSSPKNDNGDFAYNFIFGAGTADNGTGVHGQYGNLQLWGPNNGGAAGNNLPASSPDGGNYIAADGAFQVGAISQVVSGLTIGATYDVSFWYAGAQQKGFNGATTEGWRVFLGNNGDPTGGSWSGQEKDTPVLSDPSHGFTGWQSDTVVFTATAATETLAFLAVGTPNGEPPFSLLDGVSMVDPPPAPEPSAAVLLAGGLLCLAGLARFKNRMKS